MFKKVFFLTIALFLTMSFLLKAHAQETPSIETLIQEETITAAELEVGEPTLLPSSPFYFVKNWARGIRKALTFNPIRKAELELHFADEKIVEAKKVSELTPERTEAIERAVENYRASQERLKQELASLKETSKNPNVDRLLEKLTDRTVKHEKLFNELKEKFEKKKEVKEKIESAKEDITASLIEATTKDEPEKFARRVEKTLVEIKGSDLKHVGSLEFIDRLEEHEGIDFSFKERLSNIRDEFSERLKEDVQVFTAKHHQIAPELIKAALETLPGDRARRVEIIQEIQEKADKRVREALKETEEVLGKVIEERQEIAQEARRAITGAKERLARLEEKAKEISALPSAVKQLTGQARAHLEKALSAFENKEFGEAFGQARSAEVLARNALRLLEAREEPEEEELKEDISELEERLNNWARRIEGLPGELKPKAGEALEQARFHLRLAVENLQKGAFNESKRHLEEAKQFARILERVFHEFRKVEPLSAPAALSPVPPREEKPKETEKPQPVAEVCTQEYEPVCGEDGKTYPNECHARVAGVGIQYKGECKVREPEPTAKPVPVVPVTEPGIKKESEPVPSTPPLTELNVEADDNGFYPNPILTVAKGSKVKLTFFVRKENVYFGGLDFRSDKFRTESIKPGGSTAVEFTADDSFTVTSYWPASGVKKADLKVEVK